MFYGLGHFGFFGRKSLKEFCLSIFSKSTRGVPTKLGEMKPPVAIGVFAFFIFVIRLSDLRPMMMDISIFYQQILQGIFLSISLSIRRGSESDNVDTFLSAICG